MESRRIPIVVVDDEPDMQMYLSTLLEEHGFAPIVARDAAEGLEKARKMNPACIILSAMIPEENGASMYVNLKCDDTLKTVPVIIVSAVDRQTYYSCGKFRSAHSQKGIPEPEGYLEKPLEAEELLSTVDRLIRESKRTE